MSGLKKCVTHLLCADLTNITYTTSLHRLPNISVVNVKLSISMFFSYCPLLSQILFGIECTQGSNTDE